MWLSSRHLFQRGTTRSSHASFCPDVQSGRGQVFWPLTLQHHAGRVTWGDEPRPWPASSCILTGASNDGLMSSLIRQPTSLTSQNGLPGRARHCHTGFGGKRVTDWSWVDPWARSRAHPCPPPLSRNPCQPTMHAQVAAARQSRAPPTETQTWRQRPPRPSLDPEPRWYCREGSCATAFSSKKGTLTTTPLLDTARHATLQC